MKIELKRYSNLFEDKNGLLQCSDFGESNTDKSFYLQKDQNNVLTQFSYNTSL